MNCIKREEILFIVKVRKDLTGMKFERLTVIKQGDDYVETNGRRRARWWCLCDCEKE